MEPKKVGPWVSKWIRSARAGAGARIYEAWEKGVEPSVRDRARIADWKSGTLWIEVDTSAALEEISTYRREAILSSLSGEGVREIRFVLAGRR